MKRTLSLAILLLIPTICQADSEVTFSGNIAMPHIIQDEGTRLRPRPYINFTGTAVTCSDSGGKTVCNITGSGGSGSALIVQEGDSTVTTSADTMDFRSGFDVSDSPAGEANVSLDLSEIVTGDIAATTNALAVNPATIGSSEIDDTNTPVGDAFLKTVTTDSTKFYYTETVILGTNTSGGYAGSSSEGGAATTATALAANGANCTPGNYPLGVDESGAAEDCTAAGAGTIDGSGNTNIVTKWSDSNTITDSTIYDSGTNVGMGDTSPDYRLDVTGGDVGIGAGTFSNPTPSDDLYVTGILEVDSNIYVAGVGSITGGLTLDANTEANIEAGVDLAGEVTATDLDNTVIADNVTVTGWVMGASTATTPAENDNDTSLATTAYVQTEIASLGGSSEWTDSGSALFPNELSDNVGLGSNSPDSMLEIVESGTIPFMISSQDSADGDFLIVESTGHVGIGTNAPFYGLEVFSNALDVKAAFYGAEADNDNLVAVFNDTDSSMYVGNHGSNHGTWPGWGFLYTESNHPLYFAANYLSLQKIHLIIRETGNIGVSDNTPDAKLEIFSPGTIPFMVTNSSDGDFLTVLSTGNIGIGDASPDGKLDVTGGDTMLGAGTLTNATANEDLSVTGALEVDANIYGSARVSVQDDTPDAMIEVAELGTTPFMVSNGAAGDGDFLIVASTGNVGIGSTSPLALIHVGTGSVDEGAVGTGDVYFANDFEIDGTIYTGTTGISVTDSDTNPACNSGDFLIYADTSENKLKKCQNGTAADLDTTGGGSSTFSQVFTPQTAKLPTSNPQAIDAGNATFRGLYDAGSPNECAIWQTYLRPYAAGTLALKWFYSMVSATSGTAAVNIEIDCQSDGDSADVDTVIYGSADTLTATVPGTAGYPDILTDTSIYGDSCAQDDLVIIKACRAADNQDTATGDMELRTFILYEQ